MKPRALRQNAIALLAFAGAMLRLFIVIGAILLLVTIADYIDIVWYLLFVRPTPW